MSDSFFGFDPSIPQDDDGGGGLDDAEKDYDALNCLTFDTAMDGDWERIHQNLVHIEEHMVTPGKPTAVRRPPANPAARLRNDLNDDHGESDLEVNLSRVGMNDFDVAKEDTEGSVQLDPSVWASPMQPQPATPRRNQPPAADRPVPGAFANPDMFLRQHFSNPFGETGGHAAGGPSMQQLLHHQQQQFMLHQQHMQQQLQQQHASKFNPGSLMDGLVNSTAQMNIVSVEDLERGIRPSSGLAPGSRAQTPAVSTPARLPPGFPAPAAAANVASPVPIRANHQHPHISSNNNVNTINSSEASNAAIGDVTAGPFPMRTSQQLPADAAQQFAGVRPAQLPASANMPPVPAVAALPAHPHALAAGLMSNGPLRLPLPPPGQLMPGNMPFNQRLLHEIQNNHPMLFNRQTGLPLSFPPPLAGMPPHPLMQAQMQAMLMQQQHQFHQHSMHMNPLHNGANFQHHMHHMQQHQHHMQPHRGGPHQHGQHHHQQLNGQRMHNQSMHNKPYRGNGNLDDHDEYANLMNMREKQWLITIQLQTLKTDTPYLDDFYFTVYRNRNGRRERRAHQDNQMNHPFTQPPEQKGQMTRISIAHNMQNQHRGNNGTANNSNASDKTTEKNNNNAEPARSPIQYENSLGRLQYGSVIAPRKIIDSDIVGADATSGTGGNSGGVSSQALNELSTQRKAKQLLIHIESLYRLVLRLEDMECPQAAAAMQLVYERKLAAHRESVELRAELQSIVDNPELSDENRERANRALAADVICAAPEKPDDKKELLAAILAGLGPEKSAQMMTVRKGKTLLRRILPLVKNIAERWNIWFGICSTLPIIVKKEKDDVDGLLFALFPLFKEQLAEATMDELLKLGGLITASIDPRKVNYMFMNKFCISCLIVLILRAESLFVAAPDTIQSNGLLKWANFLRALATTAAANAKAGQSMGLALHSDVLHPLLTHFARFPDMLTAPLLAALSAPSPSTSTADRKDFTGPDTMSIKV